MGRCHPTREERGGKNDSLCPSTFMWVRGGMNSPLGNHWKEFFTQAQLQIMGDESKQTPCEGYSKRAHAHTQQLQIKATAVTRFTM